MTWKVEGFLQCYRAWVNTFSPSPDLEIGVLVGLDRIAANPYAANREAEFFWLALPGCVASDGTHVVVTWEIFHSQRTIRVGAVDQKPVPIEFDIYEDEIEPE